MASPFTGFDARGQIDDRQTKLVYDTKLRRRGKINDPIMAIEGVYDPNTKTIPNAISVVVKAGAAASTTLSLREDFTGAGGVGATLPSTLTPEEPVFRHLDMFCDNVFHVTQYNNESWGLEGKTDSVWNIMSDNEQALALWHREKEGAYRRQAVIEGYSANINATGGGTRLRINRNVAVGNSSTGLALVAYSDTQNTYIGNINTAWTSGTVKKDLDLDFLHELHYLATVASSLNAGATIEPVVIGGEQVFIFTVSPTQVQKLMKPSATNGFIAYTKGSDAVMQFFGTNFVMQFRSIVLVQDDRCARVTIGAGSFTASYKGPGRGTDGRATPGATVADACLLLGKGALYKYTMVDLQWGTDPNNADFGKVPKLAAMATYGYNSGEYFDATGLWKINDSSIVVLLGSV